LNSQGYFPGWGSKGTKFPDPCSFLSNVYQGFFPRGYSGQGLNLVLRLRMRKATSAFPHRSSWRGGTYWSTR